MALTGMSVEEIEEYLISFTTSWIKERFDAKIVDAAISQRRKVALRSYMYKEIYFTKEIHDF